MLFCNAVCRVGEEEGMVSWRKSDACWALQELAVLTLVSTIPTDQEQDLYCTRMTTSTA